VKRGDVLGLGLELASRRAVQRCERLELDPPARLAPDAGDPAVGQDAGKE